MGIIVFVGLSACRGGEVGHGLRLVAATLKHNRDEGIVEDEWLRVLIEGVESQARATLGDEGYEAAVRDGEGLSRRETVELALLPIHLPTTPDEQAPTG